MTTVGTVYNFPMALPSAANRDFHSFFEGVQLNYASNNPCRSVELLPTFNDVSPTSVRMSFGSTTTNTGINNLIKLVNAFVLVFDTSVRTNTLRFKYLTWNWTTPTNVANIRASKRSDYSTTFKLAIIPDRRCVVTYRNIFD
jgi:hypothetical protein